MDPWSREGVHGPLVHLLSLPNTVEAAVECGHNVYGLSEKYLRRTESALRLSLDNNTETNPEHFDDCSEIPRTQSKGPMF